MAYVLWRVFMKKYTKVRLGIYKAPVTPTGRQIRSFEDTSLKALEEKEKDNHEPQVSEDLKPEEFSRSSEERQSKTKRVKNYLKKCKNVLSGGNASNSSGNSKYPDSPFSEAQTNCAYWYVENEEEEEQEIEFELERLRVADQSESGENVTSDGKVFEKIGPNYIHRSEVNVSEETLVDNSAIDDEVYDKCDEELDAYCDRTDSLPTLVCEQDEIDESGFEESGNEENVLNDSEGKGDVARLIDRLMGPLYPNYAITRTVLVREARDLLVCEYLGNITQFETDFCIPAAQLIKDIKEHVNKECLPGLSAPAGWPLSLGASGIVLHLGALDPALLRNRECYLCVRRCSASTPKVEVALVARVGAALCCHALPPSHLIAMTAIEEAITLPMDTSTHLSDLLQNLLVSVEHALQRVPLDDLVQPCQQCHQVLPISEKGVSETEALVTCACQCSCIMPEWITTKKDTSIQTSPMFEFAGAIPHIDSDEDDEKDSWRSVGSLKRSLEISPPKTIDDIPEKLLMSGINLPGTRDKLGRPIVLCDAPCIGRAGLNRYEVATLLLYYATIPSKQRIDNGISILVLAETGEDVTLGLLDKAFLLIKAHIKVADIVVWRPGSKSFDSVVLPNTKIQPCIVSDESSLEKHISHDQAPASCGGSCTHDQLEWVEFFRELEPFVGQCRTIGRGLLSALADIRDQDVPSQLIRRFLHHQQRQLNRVLQEPNLQALRRTGSMTLESLTERAQWLTGSEDVQRCSKYARHSFSVMDRIAKRLEQLTAERRSVLEELARLRALEDEANEILLWLRTEGNDNLLNHCNMQSRVACTSEVRQQDQEFESFYFIAMRQIDKAGDLLESSNHCQGPKAKKFKDTVQTLKNEISVFADRLEDIRVRLEDTSRCFDLLARCQSAPEEPYGEILIELRKAAAKSGNQKLIESCQEFNNVNNNIPCNESTCSQASRVLQISEGITSTPIKPPLGQHRRRSVSSFAFIYKCNHHAAGVSCSCWESEPEENTESAKLKKKYVQSLQSNTNNCGCAKPAIDRKNSIGLDNIKEVRESTEDLLETSEKNDSGVSGCGRCDSGLSTGNASSVCQVVEGMYKKRLQRTCSCQYCNETGVPCSTESSSGGSHGDHNDHQQYGLEEGDSFPKSTGSEELEEPEDQLNGRSKLTIPMTVNSHLHCRGSNFDLPTIQDENVDSKTQKTLLLIMREMIQTERDYVRSLYYVIDNYIPELLREDIPQALRGQRNVVFGNIEKIYEFHSQQFLRELEMCENSPLHVGQIFLRHRSKFSLYALYNKNKPKSDSLMTEYGRNFFKSKQLHLQDNLDLASYLLKPVQRMGKYALLLQQLMKACPALPEGSSERVIAEREDLVAAEEMVKFQLRHGNDLLAMDSIRECDVNLKEQGRLLRQNEFLVSEGRGAKKSLRQVFLFEELILFSKARRFPDRKNLDLYIYKNSIKMTDIGLTAKIGDSPTKFEIWFRKRKPNDTFTLQATSEDVKKLWAEELSKLLWKQAMKNREIRLQEMSSMGIGNKPCFDIRPSADNINDRSISINQLKTAPRFRNSIVGPVTELCRNSNRPQSIISVSSISSGSTSSQGSGGTLGRHIPAQGHLSNLGYDPVDNSHMHHRSHTLNSQCSMESGIIADISIGSDDCPEAQLINSSCWPLEKSNSQTSTGSHKYTASSAQTDEPQVTLFHVPDDVPINI